MGKVATGREGQDSPSPAGKPKWDQKTLIKLLSNEKYTGQLLLQETISAGVYKIKSDGFMDRDLYSDSHETIIYDEVFKATQQEKLKRTVYLEKECLAQMFF